MNIKRTNDSGNRPETLIINDEIASMSLFLKEHGYNWKGTPSGNVLFYRTESGKEYQVKQASLRS